MAAVLRKFRAQLHLIINGLRNKLVQALKVGEYLSEEWRMLGEVGASTATAHQALQQRVLDFIQGATTEDFVSERYLDLSREAEHQCAQEQQLQRRLNAACNLCVARRTYTK